MTCEELRDHYELFVLGVAEEAESSEIREHLRRNCEACAAGVKGARELSALIGASAPSAAPRAVLRDRIMSSVGASANPAAMVVVRGFHWARVWAAVAGLAAVTAVYFGVRDGQEQQRSTELHADLDRQTAEAAQLTGQLARLNDALAIVNNTEGVEVSFGPGQQPQPAGKVFVSPQRGVLLIASRLPAAPAGKTYEMWIVPKKGSPVPAGLFQPGADNTAMNIQTGTVDLDATAAVAVTLENAGGSTAPTPPILIAAALPMRR